MASNVEFHPQKAGAFPKQTALQPPYVYAFLLRSVNANTAKE